MLQKVRKETQMGIKMGIKVSGQCRDLVILKTKDRYLKRKNLCVYG